MFEVAVKNKNSELYLIMLEQNKILKSKCNKIGNVNEFTLKWKSLFFDSNQFGSILCCASSLKFPYNITNLLLDGMNLMTENIA